MTDLAGARDYLWEVVFLVLCAFGHCFHQCRMVRTKVDKNIADTGLFLRQKEALPVTFLYTVHTSHNASKNASAPV